MKRFCILILTLVPVSGYAQKQGNVWVFANGNILDFNFDPPLHDFDGMISCSGFDFCEGVASISDSSGSLLLYTNGIKVWDGDNQIIANGTDLMGHSSSTNSAFIIPFPNQQAKYYVFTTDAWENGLVNGLRYSVVDLCEKGGSAVVEKNILLRSNVTEKLAAIRHSNGMDYWLMAHEQGTDKFLAYKISENGISLADSSSVGMNHPSNIQGAVGQMKISPTGDKLVLTVSNTTVPGIELFDFDNSTGEVSAPLFFNPDTLAGFPASFYGLEFSPDGNLLYVAPPYDNKLIQLDISTYTTGEDIVFNKYLVNNQANIGQAFHQLQLGPDEKIYLARNSITYLGVVENPNEVGLSCGFDLNGIDLNGNTSGWGLPAFIADYDYSASGICDTNVSVGEIAKHSSSLEAYPNPFTTYTQLTYRTPQGIRPRLQLTDMLGRVVQTVQLPSNEGTYTLDAAGLGTGVYFCTLFSGGEVLAVKKLVVASMENDE